MDKCGRSVISEQCGGYLLIADNDELTNVDGLSSLNSVGEFLTVEFNDKLTNLNGFSSLSSINGYLRIGNNSILSDCRGIYALINTPGAVQGSVSISNNASGCDSETELAISCTAPPIVLCKPVTVNAEADCRGAAEAIDFDNGSFDLDGDPLSFSVSPEGPYTLGTTNIILIVSDGVQEPSTCQTTITVQDNTDPLPDQVGLPTVNGQCSATVSSPPTATDNCLDPDSKL